MGKDDRIERIQQNVERVLRFISEEDGAGGTIGPDRLVLGIPNWEERTKDQRFAERVKTHGYPLGFGKSQLHVRDRHVPSLRQQTETRDAEEQEAFAAAHETVAWALDAERFLGSFNQGERGGFPVESVDRVADHVLAWLDHRGFTVVPKGTSEGKGLTVGVGAEAPDVIGNDDTEVPHFEEDEDNLEDEPLIDCPSCQGDGCERCKDRGYLTEADIAEELGGDVVTCPLCEGTGQLGSFVMEQQCSGCAGLGWITVERRAELKSNNWRETYSDVVEAKVAHDDPDLRNVDFGKCELSKEDLSYCDLSGQQLQGRDLSGTDLQGTDLSESRLDGATLERAVPNEATITGASLRGANLRGASLMNSDLSRADLSGANLSESNVEAASVLDGVLLVGAVGLSEEQRAVCAANGAVLAVVDGEER